MTQLLLPPGPHLNSTVCLERPHTGNRAGALGALGGPGVVVQTGSSQLHPGQGASGRGRPTPNHTYPYKQATALRLASQNSSGGFVKFCNMF